ncbi:MAG: DEAD/DEAH box helicase family protein [Paludibacteraceae bacterium]
MFYKLIEKKRDAWYASSGCTVRELVQYMAQRGMMRDAQQEAIKTYLYLKIACENKPLWQLFSEGYFTTTDIDAVALSSRAREIMRNTPAAVALLEYSQLKDRKGKQLAPQLEQYIKDQPDGIDYLHVFRDIFYGVDYPDYLFSLPMGAGKTYLMAAFIYLDLYFAMNEPDNPAFGHNFIVLAPSGLKSSIVPSLRHIAEFDPAWIIPEPVASQLRNRVCFEVLDEQKADKRSNRTRNPNAQKINNHQPFDSLMGLVLITNAEKVILERVDTNTDPQLFSEEEKAKMEVANELRKTIGLLPNLSIFIDEVHHAADSEIKLRQVVGQWSKEQTFCGMLGFSGTPYLEKAEQVVLSEHFSVKNTDLSNVVYHYPLIEGIGNFLKKPTVRYSNAVSSEIITNGVNDFLDSYTQTLYMGRVWAKLAIYCGRIETLEEEVYPLVAELVQERGLNPADAILKYHGGNAKYPVPEGAETAFASLDTKLSKVRIVLLVQIGKEGWDCKSLTGVILPHEGVCPRNMVLQTACRCLRQVEKQQHETAIIWLNQQNADILNKQLQQQQNISIEELNRTNNAQTTMLQRYNRMERQQVPPIDFYQLKVTYETLTIEENNDVAARLQKDDILVSIGQQLVHEQDLTGKQLATYTQEQEETQVATYRQWLYTIVKESFDGVKMQDLQAYTSILQPIFEQITVEKDGTRCYSNKYDQAQVRSRIRQAFFALRDFQAKEEILPEQAQLLNIARWKTPIEVENSKTEKYYPNQQAVEDIHRWDTHPPEISEEVKKAYELLVQQGLPVPALEDPHPEREYTYHYLPYRFDSSLERKFFEQTAVLSLIKEKHLEIYFNGDDTLTDFKIRCYHHDGRHWRYIGMYVPDFLIIQRDAEGKIHKVSIVETKGEGFAPKFAERKQFMETAFLQKNNDKFGYKRFDFLYLEDTITPEQRTAKTAEAIHNFFNE